MTGIAEFIIHHKKTVLVFFALLALISAVLLPFVNVNYNMEDYLPPEAQSTRSLDIMSGEFSMSIPNARVMLKDITISEALNMKQALLTQPGVLEVLWLDDVLDLKKPLEMYDEKTVEEFYKNGTALFTLTIEKGQEKEATKAVQALIGDGALAGQAPDLATTQHAANAEVLNALYILLPAISIILLLSTTSWVEPLLFFAAIGISILINMGTNLFLGQISFITFSVSPILQLACSLDYAIFLLHSFADNRKKYPNLNEAMLHSIKESISTIAASAATTLFGFIALVFMNFKIGADLGLNLAKGIVLSFISVVVFLPALTLSTYKLIDKTRHKPLMPAFLNAHKVISKLSVLAVLLVGVMLVPSFLGQANVAFTYGSSDISPNSRTSLDSAAIKKEFGQSTILVLLVPKGDVAKERALTNELKLLEHVTGVVSYAQSVGEAIPPEYLDKSITEQFYSKNYARIIVYTDTPPEGDIAFSTVVKIQERAHAYYGEHARSAGQSVSLFDMKRFVEKDNILVTLIAVISIFLVLVMTFKSAMLPLLLLLTIEAGIWINLSIPYFMGNQINFIGYLVISTVQLGATVDYAILLTTNYTRSRRLYPKREAIYKGVGESFKSILVSASTLATAGFTLKMTSTNPVISGLGLLLGRGTLLSLLLVAVFLPATLTLFDKAIEVTTYKAGFFKSAKRFKTI